VPARPIIRLRSLSSDDAEVIAAWGTDAGFCRAAGWSVGRPLGEYRAFQRDLVAQPPPDLIRLGAVFDRRLVGYVDLHGTEPGRRELGYVIGERRQWRRGLGRAAAEAGLRFGFATLGLTQIWAEALDANLASVRILQRLGMHETGTGDSGIYLGTSTYYRQFAIGSDEFRALESRPQAEARVLLAGRDAGGALEPGAPRHSVRLRGSASGVDQPRWVMDHA
jgi:RimJ/RimL family protein N-acetyltransferase